MSIRETIEKQYKQSILQKNSILTSTFRLIKSAIKDKDIEVRSSGIKEGIKDKEILALFQSLVKQRQDSIESFQKEIHVSSFVVHRRYFLNIPPDWR